MEYGLGNFCAARTDNFGSAKELADMNSFLEECVSVSNDSEVSSDIEISDAKMEQGLSSTRSSEVKDPRRSGSNIRRESAYEHIGLGQLEAIGTASASLGLISTLVFGLGTALFAETDSIERPVMAHFLSLSMSFSAFTICYSLLEYYYVFMFLGMDKIMSQRQLCEKDYVDKERADFVRDVRSKFAMHNRMRAIARNSMWLGLLCQIMSSMAHANPFVSHLNLFDTWSHSRRMCLVFFGCFLLFFIAWCRLKSQDFKAYSCLSVAGFLLTGSEALFVGSDYPMGRLTAFVFICTPLYFVPYTVLTFRRPFLRIICRQLSVF